MKHAVLEFLTDKLKMDEQEIDDLGSFAVTRKDVEGNEKVYVTLKMKSHVTISIRRRLFVRIPTSRHSLSYLHNFSSVSLTFPNLYT